MTARLRWKLVGVLVLLAAVALVVFLSLGQARHRRLRIATGLPGGTFLPLGRTLAGAFARDLPRTRFEAIESPGSVASLEMLDDHRAELALVSNHVPASENVRLVAVLYEETLQIVVRADAGIATPFDLRGHRVSVGPRVSGTESIAASVLHHFGIADSEFDRRNMSPTDAARALETGTLDAAFIVAGMRTPVVDGLLARGDMRLLSLGDPGQVGSSLEGIRLDAPFFAVAAIPMHAYGRHPSEPTGTITVRALLVVRADLDDEVVHALTESLFDHKVALANEQQLLSHLTEEFDQSLSPYALHPGADAYFRRSEPTFVQRYTDQISLVITLGALVWSGLTAFRGARRALRRGRIEESLVTVQKLAAQARSATDQLTREQAMAALVAERDRAILELAAERLDANEAFRVFQTYVDTQLRSLETAPLASPEAPTPPCA